MTSWAVQVISATSGEQAGSAVEALRNPETISWALRSAQVGNYEVPPPPAGLSSLCGKIAKQKGISANQVGVLFSS